MAFRILRGGRESWVVRILGHSRLLLRWRPRPMGPSLLGQLQPGVGAARRRREAAHWRRVQEGQRGGAALLRAALSRFAVEEALPQKWKQVEAWVRRATRRG